MDLVFIDPDLMRHIRLLCHEVLDLPDALVIQQTILRSHCQAQWLRRGIGITWKSHQVRMASICRIHASDIASLDILVLSVGL